MRKEYKEQGQDAFAGTKLSLDDQKEVAHQIAYPNVKYAWSTGRAMARFLTELKKGCIVGRNCRRCQRVLVPPRMFCEKCFGPTNSWVYLKDTGIVETFSESYLDTDAKRIEEPLFVGVIAIDGASAHHGFMHYLDEVDPKKLEIGMAVEAVWKPEDERKGSITDIKYFRPRQEEDRA